jgi:hypothetical protein
MALNTQLFQQPRKQAIRKNDARYINIIEKTPHAYTQKENCTIRKRTANRTERCPVQFYKAISSISDENSTYYKKNQQEKRQHRFKISSIHNEKDLSHQNRGESSKIRR